MVTAPDRVLLTGSRSILPRLGDEKRMPSPSTFRAGRLRRPAADRLRDMGLRKGCLMALLAPVSTVKCASATSRSSSMRRESTRTRVSEYRWSSPVGAAVAALHRLIEGTCALGGGDVVRLRQAKPCHCFLAEAADNW
jgi:hypothetical protein